MATLEVNTHVSCYAAHIRLSVHLSIHLSPPSDAASSLLLAKECEGKKQTKNTAEHSAGQRSRSLVVIHTRSFNVKTEISRWVVHRGGRQRRKRREEVEEELEKKVLSGKTTAIHQQFLPVYQPAQL